MAHQLETWADGSASFASARLHAWHRLGTVLPDRFDAAQAMNHAKLGGWRVRKEALQTTVLTADGVSTLDVPEQFATVRTNPVTGRPDVLGVVGRGYTPIQNEEHAALLDALVDESGAHFETAGSLRGGRQVFLTMKLPTTMQIGGVDPVDLYLVACNSHDGTSAFRLLVSPIRVVCANTQAIAIRRAQSSFSIRHTSGASGQIEQARQALGLTFKYAETFQAQADAMIAQAMTDRQFRELIDAVWHVDDKADTSAKAGPSKRSQTIAANRRAVLVDLWRSSPTAEAIRGTAWGAYQAITEYTDHFAPIGEKRNPGAARAERAITSANVAAVKTRAFDLLAAN
jgi:phage/plasmid-like protein (TIGR03299 family)